MLETIDNIKAHIASVTDTMVQILALGVVVEVAYGQPFFGMGIVSNITSLIGTMGDSGFVGLIAVLVLVGLFRK